MNRSSLALHASLVFLLLPVTLAFGQTPYWHTAGGPDNRVQAILCDDDDVVYCGADSGLLRLERSGTWSWVNTTESVNVILNNRKGTLFAGTSGHGLLESSDRGSTWLPSSLENKNVWSMAAGTALWAGSDGAIFKSTDAGLSWLEASVGTDEILSIALKRGGYVFAGSYGGGIYRITGQDSVWTKCSSGLVNERVQTVIVHPNGDLFAGTDSGVFRSSDNALTWQQAGFPGLSTAVHALVADHQGILYAATYQGVYSSTNLGQIWSPLKDGLPDESMGALALDAHDTLWVGAWGSGVFKGSQPVEQGPDRISGTWPAGQFGATVALADLNGDGWKDLVVGAPYAGINGDSSGAVYIYYGGKQLSSKPDLLLIGPRRYDMFGSSLANAGDFNGDGYDDLIVGAPTWWWETADSVQDHVGKAYIFFGGPTMKQTPDLILTDGEARAMFGCSVTGGGDINKDGYDDIIVGARKGTYSPLAPPGCGAAYIYLGGGIPDEKADMVFGVRTPTVDFGYSVAEVGDWNGDGYCDFAVAQYWGFDPGDPGSVRVYRGTDSLGTQNFAGLFADPYTYPEGRMSSVLPSATGTSTETVSPIFSSGHPWTLIPMRSVQVRHLSRKLLSFPERIR